jgi:hypothetical protein
MNTETYSFNHNKNLNNIIAHNYHKIFDKISKIDLSLHENGNIDENIIKLINDDIKYDTPKPITVNDLENSYELNFKLLGQSNIFGSDNSNSNSNSTQFTLKENKNINKTDYAYVVLYFPNYDQNMVIKNDYLLSTLLVGYSLKNMNNNYDLSINNKTGTKANVICMVTCDISDEIKNILSLYFDEIKVVPYICPAKCLLPEYIKNDKLLFIEIQDVSKDNINNLHGYNKVFTKLNIFNKQLFPYKKLILVDSDLFALGYFDTLFSLDTPAGYLEHRRQLSPVFGIDSWIYDRQPFCKHGYSIPKLFTDIENSYASDINASLLVISPDNTLYENMIKELQTPLDLWFGNDKYHKGFWLGNKFFDHYLLPEQNYLTKTLSGQWNSIDLGFCSWSLNLFDAFGFTFAGFVIKPWKIQSGFHNYTTNNNSIFSKINNKATQRSFGCQLMNNIIVKMLIDIKTKDNNIFEIINNEIDDLNIIFDSFDPWEPEINLDNYTKLKNIEFSQLKNISYDQKKLLYLSNNDISKDYIKKILYFDYIFDNITRNIFSLDFMALTYKLINILNTIITKYNLNENLFPFGNSLISLFLFGTFDITDDDNDFILIIKNKSIVYDLIWELLNIPYIQVYIRLQTQEFIRIVINSNKSFNFELGYMNFNYFKNEFDFSKMSFFNFSFTHSFINNYIDNNNVTVTKQMLMDSCNCEIKVPWVDVFYMIDDVFYMIDDVFYMIDDANLKLTFLAGRKLELSRDIFFENPTYIIEQVTGNKFRLPQMIKYVNEYYKSQDKLSYYTIKAHHNVKNRPILFKVDITNDMNKMILSGIYDHFKNILKTMYNKIYLIK